MLSSLAGGMTVGVGIVNMTVGNDQQSTSKSLRENSCISNAKKFWNNKNRCF